MPQGGHAGARLPRYVTVVLPEPRLIQPEDDAEQFRLLVASVADYAIFMLDPDGYVASWNLGAERIKGYSASEIIGRHFSTFYPAEDVAAGKPAWELEVAVRDGRFEDEGWRVRKDGSRFWANVIITPLFEHGELRGFGKVTRDLTARKEAEETARRLMAEQAARTVAEKTEIYQRDLLAIVGHDLRNCLAVVLTAGEMIRVQPGDPARVQQRALQVVNSAKRMRQIIHGIVDYTYAQRAEGIPISPRQGADFHGVCDRVLQGFRLLQPGRQILYDAEGNPVGEWDDGRLEQVIQNLVGNALKYSPPDTPVTVRWSRDGDGPDADLLVSVHNEGRPIAPELLPHVFEPFRSGRQDHATGSMGLGLFIVRQIVLAHGGEVGVTSDAEHGTTFTLRLPARARR